MIAQEPCQSTAASELVAERMAVQCEARVEALDQRDEYSKVFVDPTGKRQLETASEPQRVRKADGAWAAISTDLVRASNGSLTPSATTANVTFSGGGTGPFVTWRVGESTFSLTWPAPLPAPRIDGDTAVYAGVLAGVDLHVTALPDGFRHALEVKTPQAASQEALRRIRYVVGGNMKAVATDGGGFDLRNAAGDRLGSTGGAQMWDSTAAAPPVEAASKCGVRGFRGGESAGGRGSGGEEARSDARGPGMGARSADVAVALTGSELTVTPDTAMLTDPAVVYPLFIDPPFNGVRSKWAYANNTNTNTTHNGSAWVGRNPYDGTLYRSFFDFNITSLTGATILDAQCG